MNVFGLDIGPSSIKIAQVIKEGKKFRLVSAGMVASPGAGLLSEAQADHVALATAIKKLYTEAKVTTKKVVIGLPENQIFTRVIEIPPMNEEELSQAIPWEAEQFVSVPMSEVTLDWQIVEHITGQEMEKMRVFIVAAPTALVEKYLKIIDLAGLEAAAVDTEILALSRSLVNPESFPTMIIDIGSKLTVMAISKKGQVILNRSIPTGGEAFTRAISTSISLEMSQAEQYKIAYGLDDKKLEGRVKKAIDPVFEIITVEVKRALDYWMEREKDPIKEIVLAGGSAKMPEAASSLTHSLGIEVSIANPFKNLTVDQKIVEGLADQLPFFAVALGLAEKEV